MEILIILACLPLYVTNSFCDKHISASGGRRTQFLYNTLKFLIGALILFPFFLTDGGERFGLGALLTGAACGVFYAVSKTVILTGYARTSVAFMPLCHSAGMLVPCLIGHFFWNETLGALAFVGILLTILSAVFLKGGVGKTGRKDAVGVLCGLAVFLTSGGVMVAQKLMGLYFVGESVAAYNLYSFLLAFLLLSPLALAGKKKEEKEKVFRKSTLLCALGSAVSLCVISLVMTSLAGAVPSVILFPIFNGSGIILVSLGSVLVFKEKLSRKNLVGLFLGVLGLCLVNFK